VTVIALTGGNKTGTLGEQIFLVGENKGGTNDSRHFGTAPGIVP
jgi:hypothetical protein